MNKLKKIIIGFMLLPLFASASGFGLEDFGGDLKENIAKNAIYGSVPTKEMEGLLAGMLKLLYTDGLFTTNNEYTPCQRTALAQTEVVLSDLTRKRVMVGALDVAYTSIKHISSGGTTILTGFLEEQARGKITNYVSELISTEEPEVVEFTHPGECEMKGTAVFDKKNMKVWFGVSGDCKCRKVKPRKEDLTEDYLRDFEVVLSANVYIKSAEATKVPHWIFWERVDVEVEYGIRGTQANVTAVCGCFVDEEDEDEEKSEEEKEDNSNPEDEEEGWWDGFVGWVTDKFTKEEDKEDDTSEEDNSEDKNENEAVEEQKQNQDNTDETTSASTGQQDKTTEVQELSQQDETQVGTQTKQLQCGDKVSVEGRSGVSTFPYRPDPQGGVNFSCSGSCKTGQLCKVLPESVRSLGATCVYCSDLNYEPEEEKEDNSENDEPVACAIPSKQDWNNAIIPGFKYTVLDEKRVRVENDRPYCGMNSLAEFQKTAEATMQFFACSSIVISEYVYSDIQGACSFTVQFGN